MPTMHLGVTDIPYSWGQKKAGGISAAKAMQAAKKGTGTGGGVTTYDVAVWLEKRYGVMEMFLDLRSKEIGAAIENGLAGAMETVMMGGPSQAGTAFASAGSEMEDLFKTALSSEAFNGLKSGIPTRAALRGVSHRFKRPYVKRPARPSFIDTGLYQSSFRVWTT